MEKFLIGFAAGVVTTIVGETIFVVVQGKKVKKAFKEFAEELGSEFASDFEEFKIDEFKIDEFKI